MTELLKYDSGKVRYELIDPHFTLGLAKVLTHGAVKYAPNNWRNPITDVTRLYGALMRHVEAVRFGQWLDSEFNLPHLDHASAELMFLRYHLRNNHKGLCLPNGN